MEVDVQLFAGAREAAQREFVTLQLAPGARAADVMAAMEQEVPQIASLLPSCRLAVDCSYVGAEEPIDPTRQVALIPPVSGG